MGLFDCKQWFPYTRPLVECVGSSARVDSVKPLGSVHTNKARDNPEFCCNDDCLVRSCNSPRTRDTCYRRAGRGACEHVIFSFDFISLCPRSCSLCRSTWLCTRQDYPDRVIYQAQTPPIAHQVVYATRLYRKSG